MERIEKSASPVESTNGCPLSEIQRDRPAIIQKLIAITMKHGSTSLFSFSWDHASSSKAY
jgi:hypothetical protein